MKFTELRELKEVCDDKGLDFRIAVNSINEDIVEIEQLKDLDIIEYDNKYYSADAYAINSDGDIMNKDDGFFCERTDEYYLNSERTRVYTGRRSYDTVCTYWAENADDVHSFEGEYYTYEALEDHDIVFDVHGTLCWRDDVYWWESDDEYHHEPYDEGGSYTRDYHNGCDQSMSFGINSKFKIGFEIEKEDKDVKESMCINDFENATEGFWRKERDGSLDNDSGYELISPIFSFDVDKIFEYIKSNNVLVEHINADFSRACGGHINISEEGLSGHDLFDKVKGYTPLLYALYYGRVDKNYSKGKSNASLKSENEKYQAIKIHSNRIEFRIIGAVPNIDVLRWRCELIRLMVDNPTDSITTAYYNFDTKFDKLIREVYSSDERYSLLKGRLKKYSLEFENIVLNEPCKPKRKYTTKAMREAVSLRVCKENTKAGDSVVVSNITPVHSDWDYIGEAIIPFSIGEVVVVHSITNNSIRVNGWHYPFCMFTIINK